MGTMESIWAYMTQKPLQSKICTMSSEKKGDICEWVAQGGGNVKILEHK